MLETTNIAIACQGGGSHAAFAAGALQKLLPRFEEEGGKLRLVGISGTSGGAICALLAWYGLLQGGPQLAQRKLDDFWSANCAQSPGEQLWNDSAIAALGAIPCNIEFSPYEWPLHQVELLLTRLWPALAEALGPFNFWGRGDYFRFDALIRSQVDFELIAALGEFCSISRDVEHWIEADLRSGLFGPTAGDDALRQELEERIRHALTMPATILQRMDAAGFGADAPLRQIIDNWPAPAPVFEARGLARLSGQVLGAMRAIPQLLLGAVDVGSGEFTTFSSEKPEKEGGISLNAVLASAALPWIFEAVAVERMTPEGKRDMRRYWDGLLSQNPPIKNFLSGLPDDDRKPDECWIVQINPDSYNVRTLARNIWDRRNELAGNLSLNQEIDFIDAINRRIAENPGGSDKQIQVHRIMMDVHAVERAAQTKLGALSKFDRDPALKDALVGNGGRQAEQFLLLRSVVEIACADLYADCYRDVRQPALAALRSLSDDAGTGPIRLVIDETSLPARGMHLEGHAGMRWHAQGRAANGCPIRIKGESDFIAGNGAARFHINDIRITSIEARPEPPQPPTETEAVPPAPAAVAKRSGARVGARQKRMEGGQRAS